MCVCISLRTDPQNITTLLDPTGSLYATKRAPFYVPRTRWADGKLPGGATVLWAYAICGAKKVSADGAIRIYMSILNKFKLYYI